MTLLGLRQRVTQDGELGVSPGQRASTNRPRCRHVAQYAKHPRSATTLRPEAPPFTVRDTRGLSSLRRVRLRGRAGHTLQLVRARTTVGMRASLDGRAAATICRPQDGRLVPLRPPIGGPVVSLRSVRLADVEVSARTAGLALSATESSGTLKKDQS